jgi:hypothetical protein
MKTNLKGLFSFIIGLAVGSVVSVSLTKKKYAKWAEEDIATIREDAQRYVNESEDHYKKEFEILAGELKANKTTERLTSIQETMDEDEEASLSGISKADERSYKNSAKRYDTMSKKKDINAVMKERGVEPVTPSINAFDAAYPTEDDAEEEDSEESDNPESANLNKVKNVNELYPITVISGDDFFHNEMFAHHDKVTLTYYEGDDTLGDEGDGFIPKYEDIIGVQATTMFGKISNDPNIVHVRNAKLLTDFEILLNKGTYMEEVLGVPVEPTPKVTPTPKPKRSKKDGLV